MNTLQGKKHLNVYLMLNSQEGTDDLGFTVVVLQSLIGHAICKGVLMFLLGAPGHLSSVVIGSQMCVLGMSRRCSHLDFELSTCDWITQGQ